MNHDEHSSVPSTPAPESDRKRTRLYGWIILGLAVAGLGYYLVTDHWPHVLAALPYAGIIVVVGMHLFMHKGHSHGGGSAGGHDHGSSAATGHNHNGKSARKVT